MRAKRILGAVLICLGGCGSSSDSVSYSSVLVAAPLAAASPLAQAVLPRAVHDRYWIVDDGPLQVNVLANDQLHEAAIVELPAAAQGHGSVQLTPAGDLTYTPGPDGEASDTFSYTVGNSAGKSTATVTVNRSPKVFVNSTSPAGGDGSSKRPYNNFLTALRAVNGRPATFVVNDGQGNGQGLGDAYTWPTTQC